MTWDDLASLLPESIVPPRPAPGAPVTAASAEPDLRGLSSAEAALRAERGQANVDTSRQRTDGDVIRENSLTFFNVILGTLIAILFALAVIDQDVGHFQDGIFVGIIVAANVIVATYQEIRATHTLRALRALTAPRATVVRDGREIPVLAEAVVQGDLLHLQPGDQVVADGHVIFRSAEVDESLLTGEADSVRKHPGDDLLSGSFGVAGDCYYRAERVGMHAYAMRLTGEARQRVRRLTPLQHRFQRLVRFLLAATGILGALLLISFNVAERGFAESIKATTATITSVVPEGLLLGMTVAFAVGAVRVSRRGAIVQEINAVEALNYVDVVCLDKTGTITANTLTLHRADFPSDTPELRGWLGAFAAATAGDSKTATALADALGRASNGARPLASVPFSSARRWSALELERGEERRVFLLGAPETVLPLCDGDVGLLARYEEAAARGLRGVVLAEADALPDPDHPPQGLRPLALLTLADVLRPEIHRAFDTMAQLGIQPKIISGDNPNTVAALLRQLDIVLPGGVISGPELDGLPEAEFRAAADRHSIFGRIGPEQKARLVTALQAQGHYVTMVGDGANDVRALRAADVAVAMASGTATARAVAGIVLLQDSFEAFVEAIREAESVLGNTARLSKLFITKSLYAYVLIVATNMLGLDFPFLPRHGSLTALLTLGIPSIFIAMTTPPLGTGREFTTSVLRFALPASIALGVAAISVQLLTEGILDRPIAEARTVVSATIALVGLVYMVEVVGFDRASVRRPVRPVVAVLLGALLVGALMASLYVSWLQRFFDFTDVGASEWAIILPAAGAAVAGRFLISRYWEEIRDVLLGRSQEAAINRGRKV